MEYRVYTHTYIHMHRLFYIVYTFVDASVCGVSVAKYSKYIWFMVYFCSIYFSHCVCVRFLFGLHLRML